MAYQYGSYVQGNLFRGNYKKPGGQMYQPRTGWDKASNIGHDVGYYGALAYGLYQGREVLGGAARAQAWPAVLSSWLRKPLRLR